MSTSAKRIGRPVKAPAPGKRAPLSLLVTPALKRRIEKAAQASGRTMAAEAEARLEASFHADELADIRTRLDEVSKGLRELRPYPPEVRVAPVEAAPSEDEPTGKGDDR